MGVARGSRAAAKQQQQSSRRRSRDDGGTSVNVTMAGHKYSGWISCLLRRAGQEGGRADRAARGSWGATGPGDGGAGTGPAADRVVDKDTALLCCTSCFFQSHRT